MACIVSRYYKNKIIEEYQCCFYSKYIYQLTMKIKPF